MCTENPSIVPATEPTVTIVWSESEHFYDGMVMPLSRANTAFKALDDARRSERVKPGYNGAWYDKTSFKIDAIFRGEVDSYEGRQDFGDGDGSLIEHIEAYHKYYETAPHWKSHVLSTGGEKAWEQDVAERKMILEEWVPYMKLHCYLSAMESMAKAGQENILEHCCNDQAYFAAILTWVKRCRISLNQGNYNLPACPTRADYDQTLNQYKLQVVEEIQLEAEAAHMSVEEYAANGYEPTSGQAQ